VQSLKLTLKIVHKNELRRATVDVAGFDLSRLRALIRRAFVNIAPENVESISFQYMDDEGDLVMISSDDELFDAIQVVSNMDPSYLHLIIKENDEKESKLRMLCTRNFGFELFARSAADGVRYFQDLRLVGPTDKDVARFLRFTPELDKNSVGKFLGDISQSGVLNSYVSEHFVMVGLEVDVALRQFLGHFRLPAEAQMIDRILCAFARKYFRDHEGRADFIFKDADCVNVLVFALLMLSTDLHSAQIYRKMTVDDFKNNIRGVIGQELPPNFFNNLYAHIKQTGLVI